LDKKDIDKFSNMYEGVLPSVFWSRIIHGR
jgi:hypothetical protein